MRERFLDVPRLKVWHLLGLVAATAAFLAVFRIRSEADDPTSRALREARYGDSEARRRAVQALRQAGPGQPDLVPTLLASLDDPDPKVRRTATLGLADLLLSRANKNLVDPRTERVRKRLTRQLVDPDPDARCQSAFALVSLGDSSQTVCDCLIEGARGIHEMNRQDRCKALRLLGASFSSDQTATMVILAALQDLDREIRETAARSLGNWHRVKPIPDSVIDALLTGLGDEAPAVRAASAGSLSGMGSRARSAVPAIVRLLDEREEYPRHIAVAALGCLGVDGEPALETLRALVDREPVRIIRDEAERAVKRIEAEFQLFREQTLPDLMADLGEENAERRSAAAEQLGEYGPHAKSVVSLLRGLLSDPDAKVRAAAAAALRQIEPSDSAPVRKTVAETSHASADP